MKQDELRFEEPKQCKKEARHELQKREQEEKELRQREEGVEEDMTDDLIGDTGQGQGVGQIEALLGGGSVGGCILDR